MADRVVVNMQDGDKAAIPLSSLATNDKAVVLSLNGGGKVAVPFNLLEVGDRVIVITMQDGSKVALKLSLESTLQDIISVNLSNIAANSIFQVGYYFKSDYAASPNDINIVHILSWTGSTPGSEVESFYSLSTDWTARYVTFNSVGYIRSGVTFSIACNGFPAGSYYRIDLATITIPNGMIIPDSSFESGDFGDGNTQWSKSEGSIDGNKARIISSDSYSGTYCCEFY